jgi:hypothetical protein
LDVRRQIEQIHDLRQTRPADMAELGEFGANVSITSGYLHIAVDNDSVGLLFG